MSLTMADQKELKEEQKPVDEVYIGTTADVPQLTITPEEEKRLRQKIDCVVLPIVSRNPRASNHLMNCQYETIVIPGG